MFATSHVTVCVEPAGYVTAVFGEVTGTGPPSGASISVVSAKLFPPLPSRAVRRKCSESGLALTPAKPT